MSNNPIAVIVAFTALSCIFPHIVGLFLALDTIKHRSSRIETQLNDEHRDGRSARRLYLTEI